MDMNRPWPVKLPPRAAPARGDVGRLGGRWSPGPSLRPSAPRPPATSLRLAQGGLLLSAVQPCIHPRGTAVVLSPPAPRRGDRSELHHGDDCRHDRGDSTDGRPVNCHAASRGSIGGCCAMGRSGRSVRRAGALRVRQGRDHGPVRCGGQVVRPAHGASAWHYVTNWRMRSATSAGPNDARRGAGPARVAAGRMNATTAARLVVAAAVGGWADRALARRIGRLALTEANRLAGDGVLYAAIRVADGEASTGDVERLAVIAAHLDRARDAPRAQPGGCRRGGPAPGRRTSPGFVTIRIPERRSVRGPLGAPGESRSQGRRARPHGG